VRQELFLRKIAFDKDEFAKKAQDRADDLDSRLQRRIAELEQERMLSPLPPIVIGGALVVPIGLLRQQLSYHPESIASPAVRF
jgi:hypothetical protein